jgi:hypothetical protein
MTEHEKRLLAIIAKINEMAYIADTEGKENQSEALTIATAGILLALAFEREKPKREIDHLIQGAISHINSLQS